MSSILFGRRFGPRVGPTRLRFGPRFARKKKLGTKFGPGPSKQYLVSQSVSESVNRSVGRSVSDNDNNANNSDSDSSSDSDSDSDRMHAADAPNRHRRM